MPHRLPNNPQEWQDLVDSAHALLSIDAARQFGLITGGPECNVDRCVETLQQGKALGIIPRSDAITLERTTLPPASVP